MAIVLPSVFCDTKQLLDENLSTYRRIVVKSYGSLFANSCELIHYHISEVEDEEQYSNIDISLSYKERVLIEDDRFESVERFHQLRVLCNLGDMTWTYRMIKKVWEGDYPSAVAVDTDTKQIFLVNVRTSCIELVEFGIFSESEFESFMTDVSDREPYSIRLDSDAMFKFIDGAEGINYLRDNVFIEFNCATKIPIYHKKERRVI